MAAEINAGKNIAVIGLQFGDEGKGKVVDYLARDLQGSGFVVRFNGGCNAGHTVILAGDDGDREYRFHTVPSGILHPGVAGVVGNGVVLDMKELISEIKELQQSCGRFPLYISDRVHVNLPHYRDVEKRYEETMRLDTTKRGIGPAYASKACRTGIRLCDMEEPDYFREKVQTNAGIHGLEADNKETEEQLALFAELKELACITDTGKLLSEQTREGRRILFEGAQGTLLDVDHGTYPFVTSSTATIGGVYSGTGLGHGSVGEVLGVMKAYTTRVGNGPFVTELPAKEAEALRSSGGEFGATTGRPRRCGWPDLVSVRYAARLNGITGLVITKSDVLDSHEKISVCVAYRNMATGKTVEDFPSDLRLEGAKGSSANYEPVYNIFKGWKTATAGITDCSRIPDEALRYFEFWSKELGVPLVLVSTGRRRHETIHMRSPQQQGAKEQRPKVPLDTFLRGVGTAEQELVHGLS